MAPQPLGHTSQSRTRPMPERGLIDDQRGTKRSPPGKMAIVVALQLTLCFVFICSLIQAAGMAAPLQGTFMRIDLAAAALLTLLWAGPALTARMHPGKIDDDSERFLAAVGLITAIGCAVLLSRTSPSDISPMASQDPDAATVLGVWLATLALLYRCSNAGATPARRILLLGERRQVEALTQQLQSLPRRRFEPIVPGDQPLSWPWLARQRIWGVVIASAPPPHAVEPLLDCKFRGARILSRAGFHERHLRRIDLETLTSHDLLLSKGFDLSRTSAAIKRACDIGLATCMLVLLLPLMIAVAVAIRSDSPGPALYRQQRVGRHGKTFTVIKFRSMSLDAEANGTPRWAQHRDPRVTRVGRYIRATRMDELPQLVNIIRGDMSLVGPRPERPHFVEQLTQALPLYRHRSRVRPGLTGWAQVNLPYGASIEDAREKLAYDLYYIKNRTILLDVVILLSTIRVVVFGEGAR